MKRITVFLLVLIITACITTAFASNMGVVPINHESDVDAVSLDDLKLNTEVKIPNYCAIGPTDFMYQDEINEYWEDNVFTFSIINSGLEAQFACLYIDVRNLSLKSVDFLKDITITITYDDLYKYSGWAFQFNWDNSRGDDLAKTTVLNKIDQFPIEPLYTGHFMVGATLPNAVVNGEESLKIDFTIGGHKMTYYIRR